MLSLKSAFTFWIAAAVTVAAVLFLYETRLALTLAAGAGIVAVALDHLVALLARKWHWKRGLAIGVVVASVLALAATVSVVLVPAAINQARSLIDQGPQLSQKLRHTSLFLFLESRLGISQMFKLAVHENPQLGEQVVSPALAAVGSVLTAGGGMVTVFFLAVFMLIFGRGRVQAFLTLVPPARRENYERVLQKTYSAIGGYTGGLLLVCAINAGLTTTFLALVPRLPFFLPLGLLSGVSSLVPYAGPIVTGTIITVVTLVTGGVWQAIATAAYFVLYGQLEGTVLSPMVFRRTVHLNPLVTLLAILFLIELMGVAGAVLAVPIVAAGQIVLRELLQLRQERWLLQNIRDETENPWPQMPSAEGHAP